MYVGLMGSADYGSSYTRLSTLSARMQTSRVLAPILSPLQLITPSLKIRT